MPNKINDLEFDNSENSDSIDKIKKITIKINAENFIKKVVKIPILVQYDMYTEWEGDPGDPGDPGESG